MLCFDPRQFDGVIIDVVLDEVIFCVNVLRAFTKDVIRGNLDGGLIVNVNDDGK